MLLLVALMAFVTYGQCQDVIYPPLPGPPPLPASNLSSHSVQVPEPKHQLGGWRLYKVSKISGAGENLLAVAVEDGYTIVTALATVNLVVQDAKHITLSDAQASFSSDVGGEGKILCMRVLAVRAG